MVEKLASWKKTVSNVIVPIRYAEGSKRERVCAHTHEHQTVEGKTNLVVLH